MDLISVIIPVYNVRKYLDACIGSVVAQTYPDLQIIIVDDGSTDGSNEICDNWEKKDPRITIIHQQNGGQSQARNNGLSVAEGKYITFVDSDDIVAPSMIEYLYHMVISERADMAICNYTSDDELLLDGLTQKENALYSSRQAVSALIEDKTIQNYVWGKLYCRQLLGQCYFPDGASYEDAYLMCQIMMRCERIVYSPSVQYYYRQHEESILHHRTLSLNIDQYSAYQKQREVILPVWPELECELDKRDYPFLISTMFFYYREYNGQKEYTEKMQRIKRDIQECHTRLRQKNKLSMCDELNYLRVMYLEPIIRR